MNESVIKLKKLLGISEDDITKDAILEFVLEDAKETILNYCNIEEIPDGLNNTLTRMAIDLYRCENLGSESQSLGSISSISEGDTSVSYRSSETEFKDSILKDYKKQLNRYRKLVW
ncbi:MAG: phage head-tail connector protein [Paraclostridium sp.]